MLGVVLLFATGPCRALDLNYNPALDAPRSTQTPAIAAENVPPVLIRQTRQPTAAKQVSGWHWMSYLSASRPKDWQGRTQAERVANAQNDAYNARRNPLPLSNDLPESLQDLPLTVNVGVQYRF